MTMRISTWLFPWAPRYMFAGVFTYTPLATSIFQRSSSTGSRPPSVWKRIAPVTPKQRERIGRLLRQLLDRFIEQTWGQRQRVGVAVEPP
jgi:hypothetical protein